MTREAAGTRPSHQPTDRSDPERSLADAERDAGRVLVDSSLWIEYYRPGGSPIIQARIVEALTGDRVATMSMILIEVLRGTLTRESYDLLEEDLTALHWLEVTQSVARRAARMGFDLERMGRRVPATDLLIAATAVEYGYTLWHDDTHFETIAETSDLLQRRVATRSGEPPAS